MIPAGAAEAVFLVVAGVRAGLIGSGAGLASLVSYPALLATGLPPLTANVSNTVALTIGSVTSIGASRPELRGQGRRLLHFVLVALVGGAVGMALLLSFPPEAFEAVVPWLIAFASVALLARPYGGYFGAAAGVLVMGILGAIIADDWPRVNAFKNVLLAVANFTATLGFLVLGPVEGRPRCRLRPAAWPGRLWVRSWSADCPRPRCGS